jgi:hypothetical protein
MGDQANIRSITIEAKADTSQATRAIEELAHKLNALKTAVRGGISLPNENKLNAFSEAFSKLKDIDWKNVAGGINEMAGALERLADVRLNPEMLKQFVAFAKVYKNYEKAQKSAQKAGAGFQAPAVAKNYWAYGDQSRTTQWTYGNQDLASKHYGIVPSQRGAVAPYTWWTYGNQNLASNPYQIAPSSGAMLAAQAARSNIIEGQWREAPKGTVSDADALSKEELASKTKNVEDFKKSLERLGNAARAVKSHLKTLGGNIWKHLKPALEAAAKAALHFAESAGRMFTSAVSNVAKTMGNAAISAAKLTASLAIAPWKRLASSVGSVVQRLSGFLAAAKRIAVYRAIRWALKEITQAFKEGISNLYQYSKLIDGQFAKSMDMLATSALYVKDSLAAMVSPLVNNLAPAIDMITDKFVDLLNTINEALAAMTGQDTWTAALKYPVEYAEAADDASKSAKKLRNTLLGFDEINRLDDKNKSKRGSTKDNLDYSKMFEERKVESKIKGFFTKLKDAFKAGDMTEIGTNIGNAISGGLDKIPWTTIEAKVKRNASSVATLLNGLINVDGLGTKLGESIAKAFNVAVAKMNKFFITVDWSGIGTFLANGINGIVNTFDVEGLGANLANIINSAAKLIDKFSDTVEWESIGTFLANGIDGIIKNFDIEGLAGSIVKLFGGAVKGVIKFINDVPWADLGAFLATGVNKIITDFDSEALGEAIGGLFKKAIDGIASFAENVEWEKLGTFLAKGINGIFKSFKTDPPLGESIAKILNSGVKALGKFVDDVKWGEIGTFLGDNVNKFLDTFSIKDLGKTVAKIINRGFEVIGKFISEVDWTKVGTFISDGINGFLDDIETKKIGETISNAIVGCIIAAREFFKRTDFEKIGEKLGEMFNGINWKSVLSNLGGLIIDAIVASLEALWGMWKENPLLGTFLALQLGNLIATAIGFPKVTSLIRDAVSSAISSGVAGATASGAGGGLASLFGGAAIPVTLVAVAAAAAAIIWKLRDNQEEKNIGKLEPYAGALQDQMYDPELYKQRMYNLSLGRDLDAKLSESEKTLAELGAGLPKTTKTGSFEIPDLNIGNNNFIDPNNITINAALNTDDIAYMIENGIFNDKEWNNYVRKISSIDTNTNTTGTNTGKLKGISDTLSTIKTNIGGGPQSMGSSGLQNQSTKPVLTRAAGGDVPTGSLFFAGEAGAELIASQGSHTSVYNRDQIADSVAVGNEEGNALLRELVSVGKSILAKDYTPVTTITTGQITTAMDRQNRREGKTVVPVALGG